MMAKFQVLEQAAQLQQTSEGGGLTRSSTTEIRGNEGSMRQRRRLAHLILQTLVVRRTSLRLCYLLPPIMRILPFRQYANVVANRHRPRHSHYYVFDLEYNITRYERTRWYI